MKYKYFQSNTFQQAIVNPATSLHPKGRLVTRIDHEHVSNDIRPSRTQPLEPILFPKLRIYFADFPYLHYSIDQRLLT